MKWFTIIAISTYALLTGVLPAIANDHKEQLAIEYLELSKTKESFDATIETFVNQLSAQNRFADKDKMRAYFDSYMGWDILKKPTIRIIADTFTEEELIAINNFYKTKAGKSLADKTPGLSAAISQLIGDNLKKTLGKLSNTKGMEN